MLQKILSRILRELLSLREMLSLRELLTLKEILKPRGPLRLGELVGPTDFKVGLTGHRRQLKKESIPSLFKWAPEKVTLRDECLKIQTENISPAQKEEAKHSMKKNPQDLDSSMPLRSRL